jgi:3D (Asp-Asp-Asp) domain-containing protein
MIKALGADMSLGPDVFFNVPGVAVVKWDPALQAAHIEWQGWANPTEFADANNAIVRALSEHHGSRALGDCRNMKVIQQSDQEWSNQDWFPRVLAAGLRRMALVIPKSGLAAMNVKDIMSRVPGTRLDVAYFATLEEARSWLKGPVTITPLSLDASK